ncbi:MAG TPA: magnesium transporter [Nitrospirales bacterium]|nr:magnesium transporter [Nitrospiraceae bacterium]HNP29271.1 magnesium transporter [Nitrospirales bacterium]
MTTLAPTEQMHHVFIGKFPDEAAHVFESNDPQEVIRILADLSPTIVAKVLSAMSPSLAADLLGIFPQPLLLSALPHLQPSVAASLLQRMPDETRVATLAALPQQISADIGPFMEYPEDSVGMLMDVQFFALPEDLTVEEAIQQVRTHAATQQLNEIYIIDRRQALVGVLSLRDLFLASPKKNLAVYMKRELPTIHPLENQEQVVEICNEWKVLTIPVTDLDGRLLGIISSQDIIQVEKEEATISMQTMVGASKDERALSPPRFAIKKRLPWLQINLLTAFLAAFVVGLFEDTIARFTALAVLLPVVAGQSGNTGAQALAVVMRGLALRDIRPSQWLRVTLKESYVALANGVAVAATTCTAVFFWSHSWGLTLVIGVSMIISMVMAGFAGAIIPIILRSLKQDPAQSSSIILTTVTDVAGFFSFLGLATVFSALLE